MARKLCIHKFVYVQERHLSAVGLVGGLVEVSVQLQTTQRPLEYTVPTF